MSEDPTPYEVVQGKILQLASAPFAPRQHEIWLADVNQAYRNLSHNRDMRLVMEHLTVKVLCNTEAEPGARTLFIEMVQYMNTVHQTQFRPPEEGQGHAW